MKLYIQTSQEMQTITAELSERWNGATAILSPMSLVDAKQFSDEMRKYGGQVMFDPHMYSSNQACFKATRSFLPEYDVIDMEKDNIDCVLDYVSKVNDLIGSDTFIIPSQMLTDYDKWHTLQAQASSLVKKYANKRKTLQTIALPFSPTIDEWMIENVLDSVYQWDSDGVYIVFEHPHQDYFVDDFVWLRNLMTLVGGIKRDNKEVVVGYANQQLLCLSLAKCDAIALGDSSFDGCKLHALGTPESDYIRRTTTRYYHPKTYSEYTIAFLDLACKADATEVLKLSPYMKNPFSDVLFKGARPSSTTYGYDDSLKHYLNCLKIQCEVATKSTFEQTFNNIMYLMDAAIIRMERLREKGIKGQERDFIKIADVIEWVATQFYQESGYVMSRAWDSI